MRISQSAAFRSLSHTQGVYVSRKTTPKQEIVLRQHVLTARDRIRRFWSGQKGKAILIYCPSQSDYEQYCIGGEGAGCSLGLPWGDSYLVLGPDGNNTDVIAHELCHDELFARLGWWRVKRQIPQWFNEGLALMVDYRFSSPSVWEHPDSIQTEDPLFERQAPVYRNPVMIKLKDLETTRDFFGGGSEHVMRAYQTAAEEVARWLSLVEQPGVPALANAILAGKPFSKAYQELERTHRNNQKRQSSKP